MHRKRLKRSLVVACRLLFLVSVAVRIQAQDITFTNKTASFTNLEGKTFREVQITRGDWDGVIWREGASGGRVCYTNLHPGFLEAWGIPTNRIAIARARAQRKAVSDAQYRAAQKLQAQSDFTSREKRSADEAAAASRRTRDERMKAESEAITILAEQIEQAKIQLHRAEAAAHDYNNANRYNGYAPRIYIKESERVKIEEAEIRLKQMKAVFVREYNTQP